MAEYVCRKGTTFAKGAGVPIVEAVEQEVVKDEVLVVDDAIVVWPEVPGELEVITA